MDAEIACRGALDLEERRSSDAGGDRIAFIAPRCQRVLGRQRLRDFRERRGARLRCVERRRQFDPALAPVEHVPPLRESLHAHGCDPADDLGFDDKRLVRARRSCEHAPEPIRDAAERIRWRDPLLHRIILSDRPVSAASVGVLA